MSTTSIAQKTFPVNGVADVKDGCYAFTNATIVKDANLVISSGDILDMKSNNISHAFIQGRQIDMSNKQSQLNDKYKTKYGIK